MNTPTTEAGKAHLEDWFDTVKDAWGSGSVDHESMEATVAAIEAEARAPLREALTKHHRGLTLVGDDDDKCAVCTKP